MSKIKLTLAALALASASVLAASGADHSPALTPSSPAGGSADPCGPVFDSPPTTAKPAAPTNLRIMGGQASAPESDTPSSGPYVDPTTDAEPVLAGAHDYFDMLTARADCLVAYHLRSDEQIANVRSQGTDSITMPVVYDSAMDSGLWRIDPSGASPQSGGTDAQKKIMDLGARGASILLTWDLRFDDGFKYSSGALTRHKAWAILTDKQAPWVIIKADYQDGAKAGQGVAELKFTANGTHYNGPGTTNPSEIYLPYESTFYVQVNKWTRVWIYAEGIVGGGIGGQLVSMSAWAADAGRGPIQIYDRIQMYTPLNGFDHFNIYYDSSQDVATNRLMKAWNRNVVALRGIGMTDVLKLLQRPVS